MFTNKHHSTGGIISIVIGSVSLILLCTGIYLSYRERGNAGSYVGLIGALVFIFSAFGLVKGLLSFREKERFYICSVIGSIINGILWLVMVLVIAYGMVT